MKIILYAIIVGLIILIFSNNYYNKENFLNVDLNIVRFTTFNNKLIKSFEINLFHTLYHDELIKLFTDDIIKIHIPYNFYVSIKYSLIDNPLKTAKIIELPYGIYDIYKLTSNKIINQIDIKNASYYNRMLLFTNRKLITNY